MQRSPPQAEEKGAKKWGDELIETRLSRHPRVPGIPKSVPTLVWNQLFRQVDQPE